MPPTPEWIVCGLLIDDGRALLGRRAAGRRLGGAWAAPGGHVEPGETLVEALRREMLEEVGVRIATPQATCDHREMLDPAERYLWVLRRWSGTPTNRAPDEHDELRWFRGDELPSLALAHPADRPLIDAALAR